MFHLFGSPRSGTTLLAQCLNAHPKICIPDETDFIVPLAFLFDRVTDPAIGRELIMKMIVNSKKFSVSLGQFISPEDVYRCVYNSAYTPNAIVHALYLRVAAAAGKEIGGDKSPNDLISMRILAETSLVSPETKVIHIVRDIRDLMISLNRTKWANDFDDYFPRIWSSSNLYLHFEMNKIPTHYFLLRYEDFVLRPEEHLSNLCQFLEVDYVPAMLSSGNRDPRYRFMPHHANLYNPIASTSVGRHTTDLDDETLGKYTEQASEAMEVFGYTDPVIRTIVRPITSSSTRQ